MGLGIEVRERVRLVPVNRGWMFCDGETWLKQVVVLGYGDGPDFFLAEGLEGAVVHPNVVDYALGDRVEHYLVELKGRKVWARVTTLAAVQQAMEKALDVKVGVSRANVWKVLRRLIYDACLVTESPMVWNPVAKEYRPGQRRAVMYMRPDQLRRRGGPICAKCGRPTRMVLDGEAWCDKCKRYQ